MSVESALKFLEEVAKDEKLAKLLEEISAEDFKQALEEMNLNEVAGGLRGQVLTW